MYNVILTRISDTSTSVKEGWTMMKVCICVGVWETTLPTCSPVRLFGF